MNEGDIVDLRDEARIGNEKHQLCVNPIERRILHGHGRVHICRRRWYYRSNEDRSNAGSHHKNRYYPMV